MNVVCLALMTLLTEVQEEEFLAEWLNEQQAEVETTLENAHELLEQHRGYLVWLEEHPSMATVEEAFTSLMITREFRLRYNQFDETFLRYPPIARRMDDYYDFLAQDFDARMAVDDMHRFELAHRRDRETRRPVLAYLRAHPDEALTVLENPRWVKPLPEALAPFAEAAREKEPLIERLQADFHPLHDNPLAHLRVFPWWKIAYGQESPVREPFDALNAHFTEFPHRFWVWHRRELALAAEPDARDWLRHWHRLVRRTEGLDQAYWTYLDALRRRPELREAAEARWKDEYGAAPTWPPESGPPKLKPLWTVKEDKPRVERPEHVEIKRPARPKVPQADDLTRPTPPTRPVRLSKM